MPAFRHSLSQISSRGIPRIGRRHLGMLSVKGRRRVPRPAARRKAFINLRASCRNGVEPSRWSKDRRTGNEGPAGCGAFVAVDEGIIDDQLCTLKIKTESHLPNALAGQ